jgi:beta-xylosidase
MKRTVLLSLLLYSGLNLHAQSTTGVMSNKTTSGNPIFPGWYADPDAAIFGDTYWVYPTYSAKYKEQVFLDAFSSKDLVHWTKHHDILDTASVKWAHKAIWAPAIVQKDKKYYLFFGANDMHQGEEGGIGVGVAGNPAGPYKDHIGKALIDTVVNGAQPIDQFVFKDKDGKYYILYGGWGHANIARLKDDFKGLATLPDGKTFKEITPKGFVEGIYMIRKDNKYYLMWSEGGWTGPDYSVAYAIADSPFGPFKRIGKILQQDMTVATGAGHHSLIHNSKTDEWYIVYHRRPLTETDGNHREVCIDRLFFDKDGLIKPVKITVSGVSAQTVK